MRARTGNEQVYNIIFNNFNAVNLVSGGYLDYTMVLLRCLRV